MTDAFAPLTGGQTPTPEPDKDGECVMPAPVDAPTPAMRHPDLGTPVRVWPYRDAAGGLLGMAARFEHNGEKDIRYWTLWRKDGRLRWRCKHWPKPKPLYGLDRLAARPGVPVVVCEGEKAADAAAILMPDHVAIAWPGGASSPQVARWDALVDRDVVLWPDNDQPGWKAMATVSSILRAVRARRVRLINRELLATRVPLEKGDDASDLVTRDGWDVATMLSFLVVPDALLAPPDEIDGAEYRALIDASERYLAAKRLDVDAAGRWRQDGKYPRDTTVASIAQDFAFTYRFQAKVSTQLAIEIFEHWSRERSQRAFAEIRGRMLGHPTTDVGQVTLARWITAVTGEQSEEALTLMLHWLWLVKRSVAGLPRSWDIMPIVFGTFQGSGKSTAVAKLVEPWAELVDPINASLLTDDRKAPELERFAIGVWDEMEGAGKADIEALKNTVTCELKSYRPMRTNQVAHVRRMMCFIGTSNRPVKDMIRDTTGARRFGQINAQERIDWDEINRLDMAVLWTAISENDPTPMQSADVRDMVAAWQSQSRGRDSINEWLAVEEWESFDWQPSSSVPIEKVPAYRSDVGDSVRDIRARYFRWCKTVGENPVNTNLFGARIKEEGFVFKAVWALGNRHRYFRPAEQPRADS